ncbi:uncharacterized protein [Acropora muricata]|uniref:uncharacterized protein n=1 Tax=Acropora muricata TaxID=159855 RepID=UPI0034E3FAEA
MSDILLKTATGTTKRYTAQEIPDLKKDATFITAEITRGTYIFMEYKDFDQACVGESKVLADKSQVHDISNVNGSFYCLPDVDKGIVLFTHGRFRGNHQFYEDSSGDITNEFPPGEGKGVSSCILMSQDEPFELWTGKGYQGLKKSVKMEAGDPIDKYAFLDDFNDKTSSLRKI